MITLAFDLLKTVGVGRYFLPLLKKSIKKKVGSGRRKKRQGKDDRQYFLSLRDRAFGFSQAITEFVWS